jgi:small subunit ribosomal protein S9
LTEERTEPTPDDEPAVAPDEDQSESQGPRAASSSEAGPDGETSEASSEVEAEEAPPAAPAAPAAEAPEPVGDAAEASGSSGQDEEYEEYEPTPRQKPEIPGADLEPVFIPQEEQYLDAEAQAAAEAEAEAAAERARAEAEDEQAKPIADAAIDLAAGARYTATGKRKTSVARVILKPGEGQYLINGKPLETVFPRETLQRIIRQPLETVGYEARMDVVARMHGGGVSAQAGALRHGIARALIVADPHLRGELKRRGYLTRDPRVKERKKAGLKKARKRPQFSKR